MVALRGYLILKGELNMATYNFTDGSINRVAKPHNTTPSGYQPYILRNVINSTLQNLESGDIAECINVPAMTMVLGAWIVPTTAESTGSTDLDLGVTGVDATRWGEALAIDTINTLPETTLTFDAPLYFASADTIDILVTTTTIDTGIFEICAWCVASSDTIDAEGQAWAAQS